MKKATLIALSAGMCLSASVFAADSSNGSAASSNAGTPVVAPTTPTTPAPTDAKSTTMQNGMDMQKTDKNAEGKCAAGKCAAGKCSGASK